MGEKQQENGENDKNTSDEGGRNKEKNKLF
jgi:hypothetical protein